MKDLIVVEYSNQRILTTKQIAEFYGVTEKIITNNFQRNKEHYISGKHYFLLEGKELKNFAHLNLRGANYSKIRSLYLSTEKGVLMHAKSVNTDKAWLVYEELVDTYFRKIEEAPKQELPVYFNKQTQNRCRLNEKLLPRGYWNVETEMVSQACTLQALQKELKHWCLPSGSGGKKWINHLRKIDHPLLPKARQIKLWVPNLKQTSDVWIYPYALLEYFRDWLRFEYADYYEHEYSPSRMIGEQIEAPKRKRLKG